MWNVEFRVNKRSFGVAEIQAQLNTQNSTLKTIFVRVKLLAILPRFPYPVDKGDKLRAFHHLKYLAQRHEVSVFALSDVPVSEEQLAVLQAFCAHVTVYPLKKTGIVWRLLWNVFGSVPFQTAWHFDAGAEKKLRAETERFRPDVLFYQLVRTAEFAKDVALPKVLDLQDPMSENIRLRLSKEPWWKRMAFRREYKRLLRYEARTAERFHDICIISDRDRNDLPEPARTRAKVVSNGIEVAHYVPQHIPKTVDLVFVGAMGYVPNIEAARFLAEQILPECRRLGLNPTVNIVGADPAPEVNALESEFVTITGRVPDTRTYYARSRVMVAPMFINTGIQNKILEAAAMGIPVVTTREANEAIGAQPERDLLLARTPAEFARQIARLLADEEWADTVAQNGRQFILSTFTWEACGQRLENLLADAARKI